MTAPARFAPPLEARSDAKPGPYARRWCWFVLAPCLIAAGPAGAQLSGSVALDTDYRFRGYSVSGGDPALTAALSYDDRSGLYANGLVVAMADGPDVAGYQANIGYARRVRGELSVEAGVLRTDYAGGVGRRVRYTEGYVGVTAGVVAARAFYSPDYINCGVRTLYAEIDGGIRPAAGWRVSGHVGLLTYLSDPPPYVARSRYDWRLQLSRRLGRVSVHTALSGRGPGGDHYVRSRGRAVLTAGISLAL